MHFLEKKLFEIWMKTLKKNFWLERVQPQPASLDYPISFLQKKKKKLNSCHLNKQFLNSSYIFSPNLHIFLWTV